jgi:endoglucanase
MKPKKLLAIAILMGLSVLCSVAIGLQEKGIPLSEQIIIDQFGWRAKAVKVAIFAEPIAGQNSQNTYQPGDEFEIRRQADHRRVYSGQLVAWQKGKVDPSSGDRVWWGNFTALETPGSYYVYDPINHLRSYSFEIRDDIYNNVLKAAVRAFYYQRCGTEIPARHGGNWTHPPCHIGRNQDLAALRYTSGDRPKDVHGGWHDAGDFNKYVPFTAETIWHLINAYELNPGAFSDDYNIPESGNGVPDLLDEMKWELDWLLRMQLEDGSVANRVASAQCGEVAPQDDLETRYYTEPTTWATASLIADTANASRLYGEFDDVYPKYSLQLLTAAESAWKYLERTPEKSPASSIDYGSKGKLSCAAQAELEESDRLLRLWAAAELYRATGKTIYKNYFDRHYTPLKDGAFDPMGGKERPWTQQLAYITYAQSQAADSVKVTEIKNALKSAVSQINNLDGKDDPYRALIWGYYWGSNKTKADWGITLLLARSLGVDESRNALFERNAEEYLHYLHGRNPLSWVYLSNMGEKGAKAGAEKSVMEIYHSWFHNGSAYDGDRSQYGPAPGLLAGGANQSYAVEQVSPPFGNPPQKSYRDWNASWNAWGRFSEESWSISEPAIYYQASYVNLLAYFCSSFGKS